MTVISVGSLLEDVAKASSKQSDLRLIREGMPAYLMLIDGMIEAWPGNDRLLIAAAQGYSSYASLTAFPGQEGSRKRGTGILYGGSLWKGKKICLKIIGDKRAQETRGDPPR